MIVIKTIIDDSFTITQRFLLVPERTHTGFFTLKLVMIKQNN